MEFVILGTAAAEAWPAPFCRCAPCVRARELGGPNIRTRSGALLDSVVKIDFGPDVYAQMQSTGRDIADITSLIFTHQHDDHITPSELGYRMRWFVTDTTLPTLSIYGNETVVETLEQRWPDAAAQEEIVASIAPPLMPFQAVTTPDGTEILPLPADHAPKSLVLLLKRKGRNIFYGHDSGLYPDETVGALAGVPLDLALFDCTYGVQASQNRGHMGVSGVVDSIERLRAAGAVTDTTRLVATHFSHNGKALHDELKAVFAPHGVIVAYDGIVFEL
ncbi:MAG TPA: MBL fold metallo-hydrolase [Capsulimonadaceae bacterium]|jgi:phosphoribosyl 1,2-cyclic phosphate phosphodiesterase